VAIVFILTINLSPLINSGFKTNEKASFTPLFLLNDLLKQKQSLSVEIEVQDKEK
jgi:hypothetical protein